MYLHCKCYVRACTAPRILTAVLHQFGVVTCIDDTAVHPVCVPNTAALRGGKQNTNTAALETMSRKFWSSENTGPACVLHSYFFKNYF